MPNPIWKNGMWLFWIGVPHESDFIFCLKFLQIFFNFIVGER
jgi:hypothetical protein